MKFQINHYVPKFYLRLFSDNKKSIRKYMFDNDKIVDHSSVEVTGGTQGLYGENSNGIEKQFMILENKWSKVIKNVIEKETISIEDREMLLSFLVYSDTRTQKQADIQNAVLTKQVQSYLAMYRVNGEIEISDEELGNIEVRYKIPNAHPLNACSELINICRDLSVGLIKNTTAIDFITSDNPVAKYNYLYVKAGYYRPFGYCHRGVLLFLPLSPKICLIVYDDVPYEMKNFNDGIFTINDEEEIFKLNRLLVNVAYKEIYLPNGIDDEVFGMLKKSRTNKKYNPLVVWKSGNHQLHIRQEDTFFEDLDFRFIYPKEEFLGVDYPVT